MTLPCNPFSLAGKVALVTGATRGIGAAIARGLSAAGARDIWIGGRNLENAERVAQDIPNARAVSLDVTDEASVKLAIMTIRKSSAQLDILVNNAGVMFPAMIGASRIADLTAMLDTNIKGTFLCSQLAARLMIAKKTGSIINISSIMGTKGATGYSSYSASKAGIIGLTQAMSKELAPYSICVNALAPGFVETGLTAGLDDVARGKAASSIGFGRFASVKDITNAVVFLASPASAYITGQVLGVDGAMQV